MAAKDSELKKTVVQLENELLQEKLLRAALEKELAKPINIHEWTVIKAAAPKNTELETVQQIKKQLQTKQKQLKDAEALSASQSQTITNLKKQCSEKDEQLQRLFEKLRQKQEPSKKPRAQQSSATLAEVEALRWKCEEQTKEIDLLNVELSKTKSQLWTMGVQTV